MAAASLHRCLQGCAQQNQHPEPQTHTPLQGHGHDDCGCLRPTQRSGNADPVYFPRKKMKERGRGSWDGGDEAVR